MLVISRRGGGEPELRFPRQTIFYADIRALVSVRSFVDRGPVALSRFGDCPEVIGLASL